MSRRISVELGERHYDVHVGSGSLANTGDVIAALGSPGPVVVVSDSRVEGIWGETMRRALAPLTNAGWPTPRWLLLPPGESHKGVEEVVRIWDAALELGADRRLVIIAFGGGVVGDMAGFAAATLLRGVRLVMVPTTLLAQVDSSVGGKTGFNRPQGKNLVGAFHQPAAVVADSDLLATLDERDYRAGLGEVIKYGAVLDEELFQTLTRERDALDRRDTVVLDEVVARCCAIKAKVVVADEREAGVRQVLNFGHTVGHAVEKLGDYRRHRHGEAVAIGMVAAARIGAHLGVTEPGTTERLAELLRAFGLAVELPADMGRAELTAAVGFDKKRVGTAVRWILCPRMGSWRAHELTADAALSALWPRSI